MSGRKKIAGDNLGRAELHSVLFDLRAWLVKTENDYRFKARRRAKAGDRDGRTEAWEQADGLAQCRAKLDDLRHRYETASQTGKKPAPVVVEEEEPDECIDDPSVYLPTPEEIAAKCKEIQSKWTPSQFTEKCVYKCEPVSHANVSKFIF
jgi:hypothetical protein